MRRVVRFLLVPCLALACGSPQARLAPAVHQGPIVLITLEGLRTDAVGALGGEPGLTPNLDRIAREASWAGRAVAPSSWLIPSVATLLTGLKPWQHQTLSGLEKDLASELVTLPEALAARGYQGRLYHDSPNLSPVYGYAQGLDNVLALRRGQRASADLRALTGGRDFVWIHLELPSPPFVRRDALAPQLPPMPAGLPRRIGGTTLEAYFDPGVPLPAAERARLWALYRYNVAAADALVGRLLAGLEGGSQAERALVVVTALYGQEFGEHDQIGQGGSLGRELIEVPLLLKLPQPLASRLAVAPGERVALARLWATLVEATGGTAPPGVAPSLLRPAPAGVLSELYLVAGHNELSWLEGDLQLRWLAPFADPGPRYYRDRLAAIGAGPDQLPRIAFRQQALELLHAFRLARPLGSPDKPPRLILERWGTTGTQVVDDPARRDAMADRLRQAFDRFVAEEPL